MGEKASLLRSGLRGFGWFTRSGCQSGGVGNCEGFRSEALAFPGSGLGGWGWVWGVGIGPGV